MFYLVFLSTNRVPMGPFEDFATAKKIKMSQDENDVALGWRGRRTAIMEDVTNRKHNGAPTQPKDYRENENGE